jgi:multidrug resistance efflux pump
MEDHEKIELRSDDVQEILGTPPSWIVRWGTSFVFLGVAMLGLVSWMVKYPDIIHAPILITTELPPVPVVARTTGYLSKLLIKENDTVQAGDLLVVLQSTTNYEDVFRLEEQMSTLDSLTPAVLAAFKPDGTLNIGDLQLHYSSFVQILKDFQFKKSENFGAQNVDQFEKQIRNTEKLIKTENEKLVSTYQNLELANSNFKRQQLLFSQKVIPLAELENAKGEVYKHELNIKNVKSHIEELNGQILQLRKGILEVNQSSKESNSTKYVSLVESIQQLRTAIQKWKQQYLLMAPISGKVSFFNSYWAENQDVKDGAEVMAIIPSHGSAKVGLVSLPTFGSGKVKAGQRVVIKFESYPYQEHGVVEGVVESKALLPKDKTLTVRVTLPNGLKTSYGKELKFDQQMQGLAEVITEERRFIERMFDKLISAIKNH